MNDIFDSSNVFAVDILGQASYTLLQYNLFYNNINTTTTPPSVGNVNSTTNLPDFFGNQQPVFGNPDFVDPSSGNFELQPDSPAIDAARSEIGPLPASNAIYPTVNQQIMGSTVVGIRTDPSMVNAPEEPGRINIESGLGNITDPRQLVTLPGSGNFSFSDEWDPVLAINADGTPNTTGYASAAALAGWYNYAPITGQRDILGYIRAPQAANPALVTAVTRSSTSGLTSMSICIRRKSPTFARFPAPVRQIKSFTRWAGSRETTRLPGKSTSTSTARSTPTP